MSAIQVNLQDYLDAARRRLPLLAIVVMAIVSTVAVYAYLQPDVYRATAEFRIDLEGPAHDRLQPVMLTNYADQYIGSLRQRVLSRDQLRVWIDEVSHYSGFADRDPTAGIDSLIRNGAFVEMVTTNVMGSGGARSVALITGFRAGFESTDPLTAERIAQQLATRFIEQDRAIRTERAATTLDFLQERITIKREEMLELEAKLAEFKEEHRGALPDTMNLNMATIDRTERDLESVQAEIRNLEQDRIFRVAQLDQLVQRSGSDTQLDELEREYRRMISVYGPAHPDLIRVKRQIESLTSGAPLSGETAEIVRLEEELIAARTSYSDEHPDVIALTRRIDQLRRAQERPAGATPDGDPVYLQLRAQVNAIDARIAGLHERTRDLRARLIEAEERLARMPQVEREFQALMVDLNSARDTFRNLQDRLSLARQTEALEAAERGARITLIQRPFVPEEPAGPLRLQMIQLALMVGLALGGLVAIAMEVIDKKVRGSKDILTVFGAPPLATIPTVHNSLTRASARRKILLFGSILVVAAAAATALMRVPL